MKWFLKALKQYNDFSGRARRKEFFIFNAVNALISLVLMIIVTLLAKTTDSPIFIGLYILYIFVTFLPSLAVSVRRMHDIGKSGWMLLVSFIPLIGSFWVLFLMISESEANDNIYGPNPKLEDLEIV